MEKNKLPLVSIVIPTFNEEKNIETCLRAIYSQNYPCNKLEVIIIDNYSKDKTILLAKNYPVKVIFNKILNAQVSKMVGLKNSKGDYFLYVDADVEIVGINWLINLISPLLKDSSLAGSFGRFIPKKSDAPIGRYLRDHPLELDPVLQFFCTPIEKTIIFERQKYKICQFTFPRIPPVGICLYRKKVLNQVLEGRNVFMDVDTPALLSKKGFDLFSYVPDCGFYHVNFRSLFDIPKKRFRNINVNFLPNYETREFQYFDARKCGDKLKIVYWIIYANLFVPALIKGIIISIKKKNWVMLYEPFAAMVITDSIILGFLKNRLSIKLVKDFFGFPK